MYHYCKFTRKCHGVLSAGILSFDGNINFPHLPTHLIIHCENPIQESINIERAAYIAGLNALLASWYLFPAQQAAQPGRGIIMQTDVDYGTMTSTVSFLSQ